MTRLLTDFHHSSLLRATNILFGNRLGMDVYRPIGMEWSDAGFWAINNQRDTAEQFLGLNSQPLDGTSPLNERPGFGDDNVYEIFDPGNSSTHMACTLDFFKNNKFDYIMASIPQHVPIFEKLIELYQPQAKLIIQVGNNWDLEQYSGKNVLASVKPHPTSANACFYHQNFELNIFKPTPCRPTKKIYSFVNCLEQSPQGWADFTRMEEALRGHTFKSFGGQCRDGNMNGPVELSIAIKESEFIFHSKPGGDGFGHIIHNAYACGRPLIARSSQYKGQLAEDLLVPGTFLDLDREGFQSVKNYIQTMTMAPELLARMGQAAAKRFKEVVDYDKEEETIRQWLQSLK